MSSRQVGKQPRRRIGEAPKEARGEHHNDELPHRDVDGERALARDSCARLDDALVIAKVKATHRPVLRPSVLMEVLLAAAQSVGFQIRLIC
jgi:hypothetical protein